MLKKIFVGLTLAATLVLSMPSLDVEAAWKNTSLGKQYTTNVKPGYAVGWKKISGSWYYFNQKGTMQKGWVLVQNKWYYLQSNGRMAANTWIDNYYLKVDGSMAVNTYIKGVWVGADGKKTSSAAAATPKRTGWYQNPTSKTWYYYDANGKLKTGWLNIGKEKYYLNSKGAMISGFRTIGKKPYYFNPANGAMQKSWIQIGSNYYYASSAGVIQKNTWVANNQYHMDAKGVMDIGWTTISGKKYYFHTTIGYKYVGWWKINSDWYYFDTKGAMVKSKWVTYPSTRKTCYLQSNGVMASNKWIGAHYVNDSGYKTGQTRPTGLYLENGKYYYNDNKYNKIKGWQIANGQNYYFGSNYAAVTGWQDLNGLRYYFNTRGEMQTGLTDIGIDTYYFDVNGMMISGKTIIINKVKYTFDAQGRLIDDSKPNDATMGTKIALYAQRFLGNPYVYGGTSLTNGADCSGFTMSVMAHFGIKIPRVAADQATGTSQWGGAFTKGKRVTANTANLKPGDLVFYYSPVGHVGIYIGNGKIIHASTPATGIKISDYNYSIPASAMRYW